MLPISLGKLGLPLCFGADIVAGLVFSKAFLVFRLRHEDDLGLRLRSCDPIHERLWRLSYDRHRSHSEIFPGRVGDVRWAGFRCTSVRRAILVQERCV